MPSAFDLSFLASKQRPAPAWHLETIAAEMAEPDKARMLRVIGRMGAQQVPAHGAIELRVRLDPDAFLLEAGFGEIEAHEVAAPLGSRLARSAA